MRLEELEAANRRTLEALRSGKINGSDTQSFPFVGVYVADLFECPPFLLFTANDCPRAQNILYDREFEPFSMRLWCRLARQASGILDIGAHVGVYSLAAASLRKDINIHAFEPNPHAYTRLRVHLRINNFKNVVEHPFAVGNSEGIVKFGWAKKTNQPISSGGGIGARPDGEEIIVPMRTLDSTGVAETIGDKALMKVDVEGGEVLTFHGMPKTLARRPNILLETFAQKACDVINPQILALGYKVYHIQEKEGSLVQRDKLYPCTVESGNFNQFLTIRPAEEVAELLAARIG